MTRPIALDKKGAAAAVSVSESTIDRAIKAGELDAKKIGSKITIPYQELLDWYAALPSAMEEA